MRQCSSRARPFLAPGLKKHREWGGWYKLSNIVRIYSARASGVSARAIARQRRLWKGCPPPPHPHTNISPYSRASVYIPPPPPSRHDFPSAFPTTCARGCGLDGEGRAHRNPPGGSVTLYTDCVCVCGSGDDRDIPVCLQGERERLSRIASLAAAAWENEKKRDGREAYSKV